ncbi:hypothetical protein [Clostridium sp. JN-9]|nr:hypothetical protein [Clostridium sp. JN-9]
MSKNKNIKSQNQSKSDNSENSRNAKNGFMFRGNASKIAADQGTRNKN